MRQVFIVGIAAESELEDLHPGKPISSRRAMTSAVIRPRSSAIMGRSPSACRMARKEVAAWALDPGALTAVVSPAGTDQ